MKTLVERLTALAAKCDDFSLVSLKPVAGYEDEAQIVTATMSLIWRRHAADLREAIEALKDEGFK